MKGVPPEIDALMWSLAEEGGPVAQAEFEARHARYGPELTRRIRMVAELREAGKKPTHRPTFTPRPARVVPTPRWIVGAAVGLSILAVGAFAYVAASADERVPAPVLPHIVVDPPRLPAPKVVRDPVVVPTPQPPNPTEPPPVAEHDKPRDIKFEDKSLVDAISLLAASAKLKATIAPGFPDKNVTLDYGSIGVMDALKAMGEEYGFSVLEEEEGAILVIPARPPEVDRRIGP